jgi:hypothetical protein
MAKVLKEHTMEEQLKVCCAQADAVWPTRTD